MSNIFLEHEACVKAGIPGCIHYFDDCCVQEAPRPSNKKTKESDMHAQAISIQATTPTPRDMGKEYLDQRIYSLFYEHKKKLADKFLREDTPKTYGEARKWIKEGLFSISLERDCKDDADYNHFDWSFRWGKKPRDHKGYDAAMTELKKARQQCLDIISISTDETKRLEALKAFESWTLA